MSRREPEHKRPESTDLTKPRADFNESHAETEKHFNQWSDKMDMEKIFNNLQTRKHDKKFAERLRTNRNILTK